jgi:phage shock protein PspC (stress-responsive transcriptional regulator)
MDKTININLGGSLFQVDEEAFYILRDYIQAINSRFRNVPGGNETIEDIESRIAEIFLSQKGTAGVVSKQNVESMISVLGKPEDFDAGAAEEEFAPATARQKRLYRSSEDSVISGVCGGLGVYFNTDPVLFRILFIIFTVFFAIGFFIYIALWIAVPRADTDIFYSARAGRRPEGSPANGGLNEVVSAFGKVLYVILRIFMIIIGSTLVLTGFLTILSFVIAFVFKYPGAFSHHGVDFNINYLPDILNYIFTPAATPWIIALTTMVVVMPMIAFIYWGVRMIFWLKVNDGALNLIALILWVMAIATLSIILFNEGVSFAERSSTTSRNILPYSADTLFVITGNKIGDLEYDKEFSLDDDDYSVFLVDYSKNIYIRPKLRVDVSDDNIAAIEVRKRSSGRTRKAATEKSESLIYNYRIENDTLYLDEYFRIPSGSKWTADFVTVSLLLPENTILYFDKPASGLLRDVSVENEERWYYNDAFPGSIGGKYWILTEDGLGETGTDD